ncbi:hypothetical protein BH10BAC4_BH10BAC4_06180 [soil metagenome]
MLKGLFKLAKKIENKIYPPNQQAVANQSFSQCGEDLIVSYVFSLRGIDKPSYIDIGANDPYFLSNTALLYQNGCRGINIEANPQLSEKFKIYRPDDINLNIGIDDKEGELDFYMMLDHTLSTFSLNEYNSMIADGKQLAEVRKVKLTTISYVLMKYFDSKFPDFMSIDVEGMDFDILKSIDYESAFPKIICVEAAEYSPIGAGVRRSDLIDFLVSKGYYEYANTNLNAIMVKKEFWFI